MTRRRAPTVPIITSVAGLGAAHEAWISDIWGVLHNGTTAFPAASEACVRYRRQGGIVMLVTNAPQPEADVARMLARLGVPREAYDAIVTSGDVTRALIEPWRGRAVHHLGPERQRGILDGLDIRLVSPDAAEAVVCTGLAEDDHETPDDYRCLLARLRARGLPMICANPDLVVERGDRVVYCAGALAEAYARLGGIVQYAGKPHAPIYARALALIDAAKGRPVARDKVLAIGDGLKTDIAGAEALGLASLFIASALHVPSGRALDPSLLAELFGGHRAPPVAAQRALVW
jgi:HAD superfamily hydrolase (TIGR01459 family)